MEKYDRAVEVRLLDLPHHLDSVYTYYVPDSEGRRVMRGDFVLVPFGAGNRKQSAIVTASEHREETEDGLSLKPIISVINPDLSLTEEMLGTVDFLCERTFCSIGDAVRRLIPADAFEKAEDWFSAADGVDVSSLNQKSRVLFDYLLENGKTPLSELKKAFSDDVSSLARKMARSGELVSELKIKGATKAEEKIAVLREDADESTLSMPRTTENHRRLYERIREAGRIPLSELTEEGFSPSTVSGLEKRGLINVIKQEKLRLPYMNFPVRAGKTELSERQARAKKELLSLIDGKPHGALLYGVTGSGKTSVILSLCEDVVRTGKTAIVLVPEIALTWQSVAMFSARFGDRLAVIHSALSTGERFDTYRKIRRGDCDVVLGTRSAIFAPLENLGLIVIDEEQEHTYKSDQSPKYSAKDVARYRCEKNGALMLLCSATPSVETYYRAVTGVYSLIKLEGRYGKATLPSVTLADMREDSSDFRIIGKVLAEKLIKNYEEGHQSLLFLNRRGYSSFLICRKCGGVMLCPHCSVALTYHVSGGRGSMVCHYCGYKTNPPKVCPACGSEHIGYMGYGTQALEEAVKSLIPSARVLRMDADTTTGKYSRDEIIGKFSRGEADILLGTQMIAKGHNFPRVTLAAAVSADSSLYSDDFRAAERTFSVITQLVGRSGRSDEHGEAVVQTYCPDSETIRLGAEQDYEKFFENEIALRRALLFPPFCDIALFSVSSSEEAASREFAAKLAEELSRLSKEKYTDVPLTVFGPFEAPLYKLKNKYRMRILIKHKNNSRSRALFSELLLGAEKAAGGKISVSVDINPSTV
ncbi:MAG: primosomal protein N' [Clostridiales bacterium]|nr:primosomal protein N' [Clostridiales bacterium]